MVFIFQVSVPDPAIPTTSTIGMSYPTTSTQGDVRGSSSFNGPTTVQTTTTGQPISNGTVVFSDVNVVSEIYVSVNGTLFACSLVLVVLSSILNIYSHHFMSVVFCRRPKTIPCRRYYWNMCWGYLHSDTGSFTSYGKKVGEVHKPI